jgi:predicted chitinase
MSGPFEFWTAEAIADATGAPVANVRLSWPLVHAALDARGISDRATQIAALATIAVETGNFLPIPEYASGDEYEGRLDLGNTQPGDGRRFKGRGFVQITGRANYRTYGDALGVGLVDNPDLALRPDIAAQIFAVYFANHYIRWEPAPAPLMNCADLARAGEWRGVRVAVNGGENGLQRFMEVVNALEGGDVSKVQYNRAEPAIAQNDAWSCAPTSTRWALTALGRHPSETWMESQMLADGVVTRENGLSDATGAQLARWIRDQYGEYGYLANNDPAVSWEWVVHEGAKPDGSQHAYPLLLGGRTWNHWSGFRDYDPSRGVLLLANPAEGWHGIGQTMSRAQFTQQGPFSAVRVYHPDLFEVVPDPDPPQPDRLAIAATQLRELLASDDRGDHLRAAIRGVIAALETP